MHRICAKQNYVCPENVFKSVTHFSPQIITLTRNKMIYFATKVYCLWCGVELDFNSVLINPLDSKLYFSLICTAMLVPVHQIHKKSQGFHNNS